MRSASSMTIVKGSNALLIDVFKMPNASAAAAYDLGVKILARDGVPTDNGLRNLWWLPRRS